jgi:hypothetical protein
METNLTHPPAPRASTQTDAGERFAVDETQSSGAIALPALREFLRTRWKRCILTTLLVWLPCFWHRYIQAGDLGSHVYNVWLAQLIRKGRLPGLWLVPQWTNTVFDRVLDASIHAFGFSAGEKLAVCFAVLVFFWGVFALASAAAGRAAWRAAPAIAVVSYGYVFSMGFMNLYMAMGLLFLMLALIWRGRGWELLLIAPLLALISLAHMLGIVAAVSLGIYFCFMRMTGNRIYQTGFATMSVVAILLARDYAMAHSAVVFPKIEAIGRMMGADQLMLYGQGYVYVATAFLLAIAVIGVSSVLRCGSQLLRIAWDWLLLLTVTSLGVAALPLGFYTPEQGPMGLLPERISIVAAATLCCLLAIFTRRTWQTGILFLVAVGFFGLYYKDTAKLIRAERHMETAVRQLPPGSRIFTDIGIPGGRVFSTHTLERACLGYCFDYANYEVSSNQFRIRGKAGNGFVITDYQDSVRLENGEYVPTSNDPPLYVVSYCKGSTENLCLWNYTGPKK